MPSKLYLVGVHGDSENMKILFMEGATSPSYVNNQELSAFYVDYTEFTACFLSCSAVSRCTPGLVVLLDGG